MKKIVFALVASAALTAQAQTAATTTTATKAAAGSVAAAAPAAPAAKKIGALVINENFVNAVQQDKLGGDAPLSTYNQVGITYKATDAIKLGLRQEFASTSNRANLGSNDVNNVITNRGSDTEVLNPVLTASISTKQTFLGSNALSHGFRMQPGIGKMSREAKHLVQLRYDTTLAWNPTAATELAWALSPRIQTFTSEAIGVPGNDGLVRMVQGPSATYNFSDAVNAYGSITADTRSRAGINRGTLAADTLNAVSYEAGANFNVKLGEVALSLNPALVSDVSLADATGSIDEGRIFAKETLTYYLGVSATY